MSQRNARSSKAQIPVRAPAGPFVVGRYVVFEEIAAGGMATVHLGRLIGSGGFARTVAVKRMHSNLAKDPEFVAMFLDEAKLASRIRHPNVVSTLDVLAEGGEALLVMEYVSGVSLHALYANARSARERIPLPILVRAMCDALAGLHAAHDATGEDGEPLGIVHRDVTPHNIMVDTGGVGRVLDFGIAKASNRAQHTQEGTIKGKPAYMAPEQVTGDGVDRRVDVYASCAILWEGIMGRKPHEAESGGGGILETLYRVTNRTISRPSAEGVELPPALEDLIMRGLSSDSSLRPATAEELAEALESAVAPAPRKAVSDWLRDHAADALALSAARVKRVEQASMAMGTFIDTDGELAEGSPSGTGSGGSANLQALGLMDSAGQPYTLSGVTPIRRRPMVRSRSAGGEGEQSVDVDMETDLPPSGRKRAMILGGLALLVLAVGIALGRGPSLGAPERAATAAPRLTAVSTTSPAHVPSTVQAELAAPGAAPSPAPAPPSTAATPTRRPEATSFRPKPPTAPAAARPPLHGGATTPSSPAVPAAAPAHADPCAVPFSVDERGIKHIKAECR